MDQYLFAGAVCLMVLFVGLILIFTANALWKRRNVKLARFVMLSMDETIRKTTIEILKESMDILPDKILEVKKNIEEG